MSALAHLLFLAAAASSPAANDGLSWHWDKDDPGCSLSQRTDDAKTVYVSRTPGQDDTIISFNVRTAKIWKGLYDGGSVTLSDGVTVPATIQTYSTENRQYRLVATVKQASFPKALASSSTVTVSHPDFGQFTVMLRDLAPATAALRSCEDGRLRDWGIDVDAYWALARRPQPIGHLVDLFNSDNYPHAGLADSMERNVIARLQVGADGNVLSCDAPGHFGYPQFVDSVCGVLKKGAHFEPARDASGKAVAAPYVVVVAFRMGGY